MSYTNSKAEKLAFVPKLLECITSGDESKLDECFAQDFKMLVPGTNGRESNEIPLPPGIAGPKMFIAAIHKGFSDIKWTVQKSIPEDDGGEDIMAGRSEWTGVHTGEFMGIPPTGKKVCVRFASFDRIVDGKIVSGEVFMDVMSLLIQLGVMEPPKSF